MFSLGESVPTPLFLIPLFLLPLYIFWIYGVFINKVLQGFVCLFLLSTVHVIGSSLFKKLPKGTQGQRRECHCGRQKGVTKKIGKGKIRWWAGKMMGIRVVCCRFVQYRWSSKYYIDGHWWILNQASEETDVQKTSIFAFCCLLVVTIAYGQMYNWRTRNLKMR